MIAEAAPPMALDGPGVFVGLPSIDLRRPQFAREPDRFSRLKNPRETAD
jgi:hypothetical protein